MKPSVPKSKDQESELDAPPRRELRWLRCCLILFLLSFALDFRPESGAFANEGVFTAALLGIAIASGGTAILIGLRHLLVRPGAFLILLWIGSLTLMTTIGFLRHDDPDQILRSLQLPLLLGMGIATTHVAACSGMRATEAVGYLLIAACAGLLWKLGLGFFAHRLEVFTLAPEFFLGPVLGILTAWAACALLLKRSVSRWSLAGFGLAIAAVALGFVRGIPIPVLFPAAGASICLLLGVKWRFYPKAKLWKRLVPAGAMVALGVVQFASGWFGGEMRLSLQNFITPNGVIGAAMVLCLVLAAMAFGLRSAWRNSRTVMGRWAGDIHLMFLPFVGMFCLIGECLVRNPLGEPHAAILFGFLVAVPQFFFNRAFYLRHRENEAAITPQLILNEEELPTTWEGAFPSNA